MLYKQKVFSKCKVWIQSVYDMRSGNCFDRSDAVLCKIRRAVQICIFSDKCQIMAPLFLIRAVI